MAQFGLWFGYLRIAPSYRFRAAAGGKAFVGYSLGLGSFYKSFGPNGEIHVHEHEHEHISTDVLLRCARLHSTEATTKGNPQSRVGLEQLVSLH